MLNHNKKPIFDFVSRKIKIFDLEKDNFNTICSWMDEYNGYVFEFNVIHQNQIATGFGATRHVYNKIYNEWTYDNNILTKTHPYFVDINMEHSFWISEDNIKKFTIFLIMAVHYDCIAPFHLPPALLEIITKKKMSLTELVFFMEKIYPENLNHAKKIKPSDFNDLELDFVDHDDYYRNKITPPISTEKNFIYHTISKQFDFFDALYNYDIFTIDSSLSGTYDITPAIVLSIMEVNSIDNNPIYLDIWEKFVKTLDSTELKQLLITFGNTLALNKKYTIIISDLQELDIQISTCFQLIKINKKLFETPVHLNNLKYYFKDNDNVISDRVTDNDNHYDGNIIETLPAIEMLNPQINNQRTCNNVSPSMETLQTHQYNFDIFSSIEVINGSDNNYNSDDDDIFPSVEIIEINENNFSHDLVFEPDTYNFNKEEHWPINHRISIDKKNYHTQCNNNNVNSMFNNFHRNSFCPNCRKLFNF